MVNSRKYQKNPRVRKIRVRNSGAGNGCTHFMDAWKKCVHSAGKNPCPYKLCVLGGGFGGGGGECRFYFMGARIFLKIPRFAREMLPLSGKKKKTLFCKLQNEVGAMKTSSSWRNASPRETVSCISKNRLKKLSKKIQVTKERKSVHVK